MAGLAALAARGPVLCAGDLNECLAWDADHAGHRCGAEFFNRLQDAGLIDLTGRDWPAERATREQPPYQVDRVLADAETATRILVRDEAPPTTPPPLHCALPDPLWAIEHLARLFQVDIDTTGTRPHPGPDGQVPGSTVRTHWLFARFQ